jgi:hypothetical protein
MVVNAKNGISSCELSRALGVSQKAAWFMGHRIRLAMRNGILDKFVGEVESDESWIGGLAKNMHKERRLKVIKGTGGAGTRGRAVSPKGSLARLSLCGKLRAPFG